MSTSETALTRNKDIVRAFIDALFTKGDLGAVDDYLAEDFVNHNPPFGAPGDREGMRSAAALFRTAFPDWRSEPHQMIAQGDLVVEHFTATGSQRGELLGVPAPAGRVPGRPGHGSAPRGLSLPVAYDHAGGRGLLRHGRPGDAAFHLRGRGGTARRVDATLHGERVRAARREQVRRAGRNRGPGFHARPGYARWTPAPLWCP